MDGQCRENLLDLDLIASLRSALTPEDRKSLLLLWRSEIEGHVAALGELMAAPPRAAVCAHQLKGAAASFGARRLAALAGGMEAHPDRALLGAIKEAAPVSIAAVENAMLRA